MSGLDSVEEIKSLTPAGNRTPAIQPVVHHSTVDANNEDKNNEDCSTLT
jgi:hypothetical protein